ncbi:uncharacterized protein [Blastocystis hominis]|uniref:Uncharacterized protein n=1 Tax=Blastocystis hominis TaxID=12968 RepID=D8LWW5_BLAHO|nr:uncharacterized protein [Blastocystis hominis]CBK20760.2 unnamed protein product [Blastocystis hominis]|eukprot:XP_012894808.1 uncharacterized protein [Blastocystis hominis]
MPLSARPLSQESVAVQSVYPRGSKGGQMKGAKCRKLHSPSDRLVWLKQKMVEPEAPSLLTQLLGSEIFNENSCILQCFKYIVDEGLIPVPDSMKMEKKMKEEKSAANEEAKKKALEEEESSEESESQKSSSSGSSSDSSDSSSSDSSSDSDSDDRSSSESSSDSSDTSSSGSDSEDSNSVEANSKSELAESVSGKVNSMEDTQEAPLENPDQIFCVAFKMDNN